MLKNKNRLVRKTLLNQPGSDKGKRLGGVNDAPAECKSWGKEAMEFCNLSATIVRQ